MGFIQSYPVLNGPVCPLVALQKPALATQVSIG